MYFHWSNCAASSAAVLLHTDGAQTGNSFHQTTTRVGCGKEQLPCVDQFSFDLCCCSMPSFLNRAVRSTGGCCIISARAALYAISDCKLAGKPGISRHMSATWAHSRRLRFRSVQGVRSKGCAMTTGKSNGIKQAARIKTTSTEI